MMDNRKNVTENLLVNKGMGIIDSLFRARFPWSEQSVVLSGLSVWGGGVSAVFSYCRGPSKVAGYHHLLLLWLLPYGLYYQVCLISLSTLTPLKKTVNILPLVNQSWVLAKTGYNVLEVSCDANRQLQSSMFTRRKAYSSVLLKEQDFL